MKIDITYCTAKNCRPDADRVLAETKLAAGVSADLIPGSAGIFEVQKDCVVIFSKYKLERFPKEGEIADLLTEVQSGE